MTYFMYIKEGNYKVTNINLFLNKFSLMNIFLQLKKVTDNHQELVKKKLKSN